MPPQTRQAGKRKAAEAAVLVLIIAACLAAVFPGTAFRGEMASPASLLYDAAPWSAYAPPGWQGSPDRDLTDMLNQGRPWHHLTHQAIEAGEWPLWNPAWAFGLPLMANGQSAIFYPSHWLHAFLDTDLTITLCVFFRLAACGLAAYLCGRGLRFGPAVARFLAAAWMLSSYNQVYCNWPLVDASAWFPLMFLGTESLLQYRLRRGFWILTLAITLSLFAGHPETTFVGALGLGTYFLLRLAFDGQWRRSWQPTGVFIACWCIAPAVAAIQIVPLIEFILNGVSPFQVFQAATPRPLTPPMTALLWVQRFFGVSQDGSFWGDFNSVILNALYPGLPVVLVLALGFARRKNATTPEASPLHLPSLALATLFVSLLAFNVPVLKELGRVPVFSSVLLHHYAIFPLFAVTILAAAALDRWLESPRRIGEVWWCLLPALLGIIVVACVLYTHHAQIAELHRQEYILGQVLTAAGLFLATTLILAMHPFGVRASWVAGALTLLLAADLVWANRGFTPTIQQSRIVPDTALTKFLQGLPKPYRIDTADTNIPPGFLACYDLETMAGFDAIMPKRMMELFAQFADDSGNDDPNPFAAIVLLDPKVASPPPERYKKMEHLASLDGIEVYKNPLAFPRAALVDKVEVVPDIQAIANRLKASKPEDSSLALLTESPPRGTLPHNAGKEAGTARITSYRPSRVEVEATAIEPAALMLSDIFYPGWVATVDTRPAEIFPVEYIFRAVLVDPGTHRVVFEYRPRSVSLGAGISIVTVVSLAVLAATTRRRISAHGGASQGHIFR